MKGFDLFHNQPALLELRSAWPGARRGTRTMVRADVVYLKAQSAAKKAHPLVREDPPDSGALEANFIRHHTEKIEGLVLC